MRLVETRQVSSSPEERKGKREGAHDSTLESQEESSKGAPWFRRSVEWQRPFWCFVERVVFGDG